LPFLQALTLSLPLPLPFLQVPLQHVGVELGRLELGICNGAVLAGIGFAIEVGLGVGPGMVVGIAAGLGHGSALVGRGGGEAGLSAIFLCFRSIGTRGGGGIELFSVGGILLIGIFFGLGLGPSMAGRTICRSMAEGVKCRAKFSRG
jgi:hypothetical protein